MSTRNTKSSWKGRKPLTILKFAKFTAHAADCLPASENLALAERVDPRSTRDATSHEVRRLGEYIFPQPEQPSNVPRCVECFSSCATVADANCANK